MWEAFRGAAPAGRAREAVGQDPEDVVGLRKRRTVLEEGPFSAVGARPPTVFASGPKPALYDMGAHLGPGRNISDAPEVTPADPIRIARRPTHQVRRANVREDL